MLRFAVCVLALSVAVPEVFSAPAVAAASSSAKKRSERKRSELHPGKNALLQRRKSVERADAALYAARQCRPSG